MTRLLLSCSSGVLVPCVPRTLYKPPSARMALRQVASDQSWLHFCDMRSAATANTATNDPSHTVPLPLNISSPVELPVEFDAAAKFAINRTTAHAAARGPSDLEELPLIISSPVELPVEFPVEFDAAATFARSKTTAHAAARGPSAH